MIRNRARWPGGLEPQVRIADLILFHFTFSFCFIGQYLLSICTQTPAPFSDSITFDSIMLYRILRTWLHRMSLDTHLSVHLRVHHNQLTRKINTKLNMPEDRGIFISESSLTLILSTRPIVSSMYSVMAHTTTWKSTLLFIAMVQRIMYGWHWLGLDSIVHARQ